MLNLFYLYRLSIYIIQYFNNYHFKSCSMLNIMLLYVILFIDVTIRSYINSKTTVFGCYMFDDVHTIL
jgi:hypothetical protein